MKISDLRVIGNSIGRDGVSERAIELINSFDGSYKGAVILCGQLSVLAKVCSFDSYWDEQVKKGVRSEEFFLSTLRGKS